MVANSRRKFGKVYPFMRFSVHDIEKSPAEELRGHLHLVLASKAIYATRNVVPFIDLVFGLLEGWWLFDDGRTHAVVPAEHWETELQVAGFGHVDWTDSDLPENTLQKVIIAQASGAPGPRLPKPAAEPTTELDRGDLVARTAEAERFVTKHSAGWDTPRLQALAGQVETQGARRPSRKALGAVVLGTGATGSLGSHLVQKLAEDPAVAQVVFVSSIGGYWNPVEHFALLGKSAQALNAWPDLDGALQWIPVDHCAGVIADLFEDSSISR